MRLSRGEQKYRLRNYGAYNLDESFRAGRRLDAAVAVSALTSNQRSSQQYQH